MKRKSIMTMALAMALTAGSLSGMTVPMTVHAAEADEGVEAHDENNDVGDILDGIFGGNKPEYNPDGNYDDADRNNGKDDSLSLPGGGSSDSGSSGGGSSQPEKPAEPSTPPSNPSDGNSGNSGSDNNDVGNILDDMFGGNKPEYNPGGNYDDADRNNGKDDSLSLPGGGSSNSGTTGTATTPAAPGVPTLAQPGVPAAVQPGAGTGAAGNGLTVMNPIAVAPTAVATPIADPEILALFPNAAFVQTATGVTLHAFDQGKRTYQVWEAGNVVTELSIIDAKNRVLLMDTPQLIPGADGRVFLNVTVNTKKTVKVNATDAQKAVFMSTYGIHGVMVNGILVEEFVIPVTVPVTVVQPVAK